MDIEDRNPLALAAAIALLEILDPERLEAMLHARSPFRPDEEDGWPAGGNLELIEERWEEVEEAIARLAFWQRKAEDLPEPSAEQSSTWGEALAGWPPPGQDPSVSAQHFETALALAIKDAAKDTTGSFPRRASP